AFLDPGFGRAREGRFDAYLDAGGVEWRQLALAAELEDEHAGGSVAQRRLALTHLDQRHPSTPAGGRGHVLFAVESVGDRRGDRHVLRVELPQHLAVGGAISRQLAVRIALEDEIARGAQ